MLFVTHVAVGAVIGRATRRPAVALAAGVASHFALDAVPHWAVAADFDAFMAIARVDGLAGIVVAVAAILLSRPGVRLAVALGVLGAGLPDLDKPMQHLFGIQIWPDWVNALHSGVQHESLAWWPTDLLAGAAALITLALLVARQRSVVTPAEDPCASCESAAHACAC